MTRRRPKPPLDHEVVELLREEPELLAIADALTATREQTRTRLVRRSSAAVAAALVAIAVVMAIVLTSSSPSLVERALAAVGDRPLVRAEFSRAVANDEVVGLNSGTSRRSTVRVTAIADDVTGLMRVRVVHNGTVVADQASRTGIPSQAAGTDALVAAFVRNYRPALRSRAVTTRRLGAVTALTLPGAGLTVEVGADGHPARISGNRQWRVLAAGSTADRQMLVPSRRAAGFIRGDVISHTPLAVVGASRALAGQALIPTIDGSGPHRVFDEQLRSIGASGNRRSGAGLRLEFGRGLVILEALRPEAAYRFAEGLYTFDFNPIPTAAIDLHGGGTGPWLGQMKLGGVYVTVRAPNRQLVLAAARALAR
jgi:hypothetical protein